MVPKHVKGKGGISREGSNRAKEPGLCSGQLKSKAQVCVINGPGVVVPHIPHKHPPRRPRLVVAMHYALHEI